MRLPLMRRPWARLATALRGAVLLGLGLGLVLGATPAFADRMDDLVKSLSSDPSYKVRVQAALVLGKLKDARAIPALSQALRDQDATVRGTAASALGQIGNAAARDALEGAAQDVDGFVRGQAQKALAMLGTGTTTKPPTGKGARFYMAIGFQTVGKAGPEYATVIREALAKELQKLPDVTLTVGTGDPTAATLSQHKLQGFVVDGTIQRLTATMAGGQAQIDCDLKAFVATYPAKSIKMMTTEGASLQVGANERESAKKDCIQAAAEAIKDDVGKYLKTVQ